MQPGVNGRGLLRAACSGPNWRGIGRVEVHADLAEAGLSPGAVLVIAFDRRSVEAGRYLVHFDGLPAVLRFKQCRRGLRAWIDGQWIAVLGADLRDMAVVGRVMKVCPAGV